MAESNQKPCTNCRRRKVRCDKQTPCANCARSNRVCLYEDQDEAEGMAPLILDKPTTVHLFDRLSSLEQTVSRLSEVNLQSNDYAADEKAIPSRPAPASNGAAAFPLARYHSPQETANQTFPSVQESNALVQLFLELTEPFIKMVHVPFFTKQLADYHAGDPPLHFEVVLACVHALALATLSSKFVLDFFRRPREKLLGLLRSKAEDALTKADFMRSEEHVVLRGLMYFINFLFEIGDIEYASSLVGVALRAALRINLHHDFVDGSPFVRDARRRLWHHLRYLDSRAAHLLGLESTIKAEWNPPEPKNAFDETWEDYRIAQGTSPDGPPTALGYADTSFVLMRAEIQTLQDQIRSANMSFEQMENYISGRKQEMWLQYLSESGNKPLQRFMTAILEVHIGDVYLTARQAHHKEATDDFRGGTFLAGIEVLERISALEVEMEYFQYAWVLRSFLPMRAIVTVLTCTLFKSNPGCEARGWEQIDKIYARYDNPDCQLAKTSIFDAVTALRERALEMKKTRDMQRGTQVEI